MQASNGRNNREMAREILISEKYYAISVLCKSNLLL